MSPNPEELLPTRDGLARAAELLRAGRLVAFPTETVYGLGARADRDEPVRRIFEAKGRRETNPLIVHVADLEAAARLARALPPLAERLAERLWPGPLTLVLEARPGAVSRLVTAGGPTVGVRIPRAPVALELLREAALPVAAPSANRSLAISPTTAAHVRASLGARVDAVLDGGPCEVGVESTVVDVTREPPEVLRFGGVPLAALREIAGDVVARGRETEADGARAPGRELRHYAPRIPLWLGLAPPPEAQGRVARVTFGRGGDVDLGTEPERAAARLYATLHALEAQADGILVEPPPDGEGWEAIRDRLTRAAAR